MEKLFEMKTKYTLEEHMKFNYALVFNLKGILVITVLCLFLIAYGIYSNIIYLTAFAILFPIFFVLSIHFTAKKNYTSNKAVKDAEITIEFYDNYFEQKTNVGSYKVEHDKINKIIETKTHFYIMISKNQGVIIPKASMPRGLENHIKKMLTK